VPQGEYCEEEARGGYLDPQARTTAAFKVQNCNLLLANLTGSGGCCRGGKKIGEYGRKCAGGRRVYDTVAGKVRGILMISVFLS